MSAHMYPTTNVEHPSTVLCFLALQDKAVRDSTKPHGNAQGYPRPWRRIGACSRDMPESDTAADAQEPGNAA